MSSWKVQIHFTWNRSDSASVKQQLLAQLEESVDRAVGCRFGGYHGTLDFVLDADTEFSVNHSASLLLGRLQRSIQVPGLTIEDFTVGQVTKAKDVVEIYKVGFRDGSWIEISAAGYSQYGRGHDWKFVDGAGGVVGTFRAHLVMAIVRSDRIVAVGDGPEGSETAEGADDTSEAE